MGRYVDEGVIFEGVGVLGVVMFLVLICSGFAVRGSRFAVWGVSTSPFISVLASPSRRSTGC